MACTGVQKKTPTKHNKTSVHVVIFSERNSLTIVKDGQNDYTQTQVTTYLGMWWPNPDQGKTSWREKTLQEEKNPST